MDLHARGHHCAFKNAVFVAQIFDLCVSAHGHERCFQGGAICDHFERYWRFVGGKAHGAQTLEGEVPDPGGWMLFAGWFRLFFGNRGPLAADPHTSDFPITRQLPLEQLPLHDNFDVTEGIRSSHCTGGWVEIHLRQGHGLHWVAHGSSEGAIFITPKLQLQRPFVFGQSCTKQSSEVPSQMPVGSSSPASASQFSRSITGAVSGAWSEVSVVNIRTSRSG